MASPEALPLVPMPSPPLLLSPPLLIEFFHYVPSLGAAYAVMAVFAALSLANLAMTLRYRPRAKYLYFIFLTGVIEVIGYYGRAQTIKSPALNPFIISTLCIILAPILLAVVNYNITGQLMEGSGRTMGWLKPKYVARVFVSSDVLCLVIQGAAGALLSSQNATSQKLGRNIILAGLALQLVFYAVFAVVTHQLRARPQFNLHRIENIRGLYIELYATIGLLFVRNLYRVVDFADTLHPTSYLESHEWFFYIFEAAPLLLCMCIYTTWHLGRVLPAPKELALLLAADEVVPTQELASLV